MKTSLFKAGVLVAIAAMLTLGGCVLSSDEAQDVPTNAEPTEAVLNNAEPAIAEPEVATEAAAKTDKPKAFEVQPPTSEVVPDDAKAAASTLSNAPLPMEVQPYSTDELFAAGSGGCGMSLWRAEGSYGNDSVLFSGMGEGPQLLMKLNGEFVTFERMEGSGPEFYGQFAQQRFRNLNGDIEVTTEVELGAKGDIESVEIDQGKVVLSRNGVTQEIAVKGDAGC